MTNNNDLLNGKVVKQDFMLLSNIDTSTYIRNDDNMRVLIVTYRDEVLFFT
jgi:hypothetical protein